MLKYNMYIKTCIWTNVIHKVYIIIEVGGRHSYILLFTTLHGAISYEELITHSLEFLSRYDLLRFAKDGLRDNLIGERGCPNNEPAIILEQPISLKMSSRILVKYLELGIG